MDLRAALDASPPASQTDLRALASWSPVLLPSDYIDFLGECNGGSGTRSEYPTYIRLWSARAVIENNTDYEMQRWVPGLVGFGDDGGPMFLAFDTRAGAPYPVVVVPFVPMEYGAAQFIAAGFSEFATRFRPSQR